jgi:hypothetical protein
MERSNSVHLPIIREWVEVEIHCEKQVEKVSPLVHKRILERSHSHPSHESCRSPMVVKVIKENSCTDVFRQIPGTNWTVRESKTSNNSRG